MHIIDSWELLRTGESDQAMHQLRQAYIEAPDASNIMKLGVAHLWLQQYELASDHFRKAIETYPRKMDVFYGMAGVAKWCLADTNNAVLQWKYGLEAKYADTAGLGVKMPLLLFFASVVKPESFAENDAKKLLLGKIKDPRIKTWCGPVAQFILGQIDENKFNSHCKGANDRDTRERYWLAEFYKNVIRRKQIGVAAFRKSMQNMADTSQPEWKEKELFLDRMSHEEFFIARGGIY